METVKLIVFWLMMGIDDMMDLGMMGQKATGGIVLSLFSSDKREGGFVDVV